MGIIKKIDRNADLKYWEGNIPVYFLYTKGIAGDLFSKGLKEGKLLGALCKECKSIYIPPRIYCEECMNEIIEFPEVKKTGRIITFTEVFEDAYRNKLEKPETIAFIRPDGTNGGFIIPVTFKVRIGQRVRIEFIPENERKGNLYDIICTPL